MNITKTENNGQTLLKLEGWLDTAAAPELGKNIEELTSANEIILDFDEVEYIASSGLRQIVACHRKAKELNASFSLINVHNEIMNILKLTGLDKKLDIQEK